MRRVLPAAIFLLALAIAWWFWPRTPRGTSPVTAASRVSGGPDAASPQRATPPPPASIAAATAAEEQFPLVATLNAPGSTIARDLDALSQVFDAWRTNFPREGNPVGENSDITAALAGENPLGLVLIPKSHRAINARGELCDRWGVPFRFHQLSGERMEIRSAGPDRQFATGDDALWSPP